MYVPAQHVAVGVQAARAYISSSLHVNTTSSDLQLVSLDDLNATLVNQIKRFIPYKATKTCKLCRSTSSLGSMDYVKERLNASKDVDGIGAAPDPRNATAVIAGSPGTTLRTCGLT